jgi:hypothetical protein
MGHAAVAVHDRRNIFADNVALVQDATTPGNGDEPGDAVTIAANGAVSQ